MTFLGGARLGGLLGGQFVCSDPSNLAITDYAWDHVDLSWTDASGGTAAFSVERMNGGAWAEIGTAVAGVTTYTDNTVAVDVTYSYRVRALCVGVFYSGYSNTVSQAIPFDPQALSWTFYFNADSDTLYQDAAKTIPATSDGDPVGGVLHHWLGEVGGSFDQNVLASKPTLKTGANGINNKSVLSFDGGDYLSNAALAALADTQGTLFVVCDLTSWATSRALFTVDRTSALGIFWLGAILDDATYDGQFVYMARTGAFYDLLRNSTAQEFATPSILTAESDDSALSVRVNGGNQSLTTIVGANNGRWIGDITGRDTAYVGVLFSFGAGLVYHWVGKIACIYYSSTKLSAADRANMESWASDYYNISIP